MSWLIVIGLVVALVAIILQLRTTVPVLLLASSAIALQLLFTVTLMTSFIAFAWICLACAAALVVVEVGIDLMRRKNGDRIS